MELLGLLGGMSCESSALYYKGLNDGVRKIMGGLSSAPLIMWSFDFEQIAAAQEAGSWEILVKQLSAAAGKLERAGAAAILICSNTMHRLAPEIEASIKIPLLHIGDAVGARLKEFGCTSIGLLGTKFTMEQSFYRDRLKDKFGIDVVMPRTEDRHLINHIIYSELCRGIVTSPSREIFARVIGDLRCAGAQGIVLGCTEIGLLIDAQEDSHFPIIDSTQAHVALALDWLTHRNTQGDLRIAGGTCL